MPIWTCLADDLVKGADLNVTLSSVEEWQAAWLDPDLSGQALLSITLRINPDFAEQGH